LRKEIGKELKSMMGGIRKRYYNGEREIGMIELCEWSACPILECSGTIYDPESVSL
jgi:hypothetical protein